MTTDGVVRKQGTETILKYNSNYKSFQELL